MKNEIKNSIDYISKKTSKEPGFSTPSNYFDNLEDIIDMKITEETFTKKTAFKVPDTYFSNIEDCILEQVSYKEKETKVISFRKRALKSIPYVAAASVALFISLNTFIFNTDKNLTIDSLSDNEIENWLASNDIKTNDIAFVFEDEILGENDFSMTTLQDEELEDYINSIDNSTLLNEIN